MRLTLIAAGLCLATLGALPAPAQAEIYTYTDKNGTLVFTDRLAELPLARRRYYNRKAAQQKAEAAQLEKALGKPEYERQKREAQAAKKADKRAAQAEAAQKNRALGRALSASQRRQATLDKKRDYWQKRAKTVRGKTKALYAEYKKTKTAYEALAIKADFSLYPAQRQEKAALALRLKQLKAELQAAIKAEAALPEEARKAGAYPGWIR